MEKNIGVLVLGHGSSLPYNKEVVSAVAEMIGKSDEKMVVKTAFLNLDTPTLHEGLKSFEGTGVERIVALPCFLAPGVHTTQDIPQVLGIKEGENRTTIQIDDNEIELLYAQPLGADLCIASLACARIADVLQETGMPDWAQLWEQGMRESSWIDDITQQANSVNEYWDDQSPRYNRGHDAYRSPVVDRLDKYINSNTTLLDVGAGTGALTIPMAKKVKKVLSIEPSAGMLEYLKNIALKEDLSNIEFINETWEGAEVSGQYDLVVCSHALYFIQDIKKSLQRMIDVTGKHLFLMVGVHDNNDKYGDIWEIIKGTSYKPGPDYIYIYNLLRELGWHPDVEMIPTTMECASMDEALRLATSHFDESDVQAKQEELRSYLSQHVRQDSDGKFRWNDSFKSAMIVVNKDV
ncbi:MAG: sirohydrochlorin nickelochelatase [Euryarchaeota archaeon]|nr:sirohydrochlorin nickelochelatase [Euryarchaeota archaeon]